MPNSTLAKHLFHCKYKCLACVALVIFPKCLLCFLNFDASIDIDKCAFQFPGVNSSGLCYPLSPLLFEFVSLSCISFIKAC